MSSYRQITAITIVTASLFYLWSRYCRKKKRSQYLLNQAFTHMAFGTLLCCGTNPFRKRKKSRGKNKAPYKKRWGTTVSPVSNTEADKQEQVASSLGPVEVAESGTPSAHLLAQANLSASLTRLETVSEVVLPQVIAESSQELGEELVVSTQFSPVQFGPIIKAHQSPEIPTAVPEVFVSLPANSDLVPSKQVMDINSEEVTHSAVGSTHMLAPQNSYQSDDDVDEEFRETFQSVPKSYAIMEAMGANSVTETSIQPTKYMQEYGTESEALIESEGTTGGSEFSEHTDIKQREEGGSSTVISQDLFEFSNLSKEVNTDLTSDLQQKLGETEPIPELHVVPTKSMVTTCAAQISDHSQMQNTELETSGYAEDVNVEAVGLTDALQRLSIESVNSNADPVLTITETEEESGSDVIQDLAEPASIIVENSFEQVSFEENTPSIVAESDVTSKTAESPHALGETELPLKAEVDSVSPGSRKCENVLVDKDSDQVTKSDAVIVSNSQSTVVPTGIFNDPENDIEEDSPEMLDGTLIPRVFVPSDLLAKVVDDKVWVESINVPACMGGVFIGRFGKNIRELKTDLQAEMTLSMNPGCQNSLLLKISCPLENKKSVSEWVSKRLNTKPSQTTIGNPNQLQRLLPLGQVSNVLVRSLYGQKELFVTIQDAEYTRYLQMQEELDKDYSTLNTSRMQLYEPVTSGTVAILPHQLGFARVVILKVIVAWPRQALCFMLDHGIFAIAPITDLRKIKAKYMRVQFQAIHVSWAHALPVFSDAPDLHILRTFFANKKISVFPVRMETCCRSSVVFLERVQSLSPNSQPVYCDLLPTAYQCNLYHIVPVVICPNRQMWVNRADTPYYVCPYSTIPYDQCVHYVPDVDAQPPQSEEQPPHGLAPQHGQQEQLNYQQQQQRGFYHHGYNRSRRFGNSNRGGGGGFKKVQKPLDHTNGANNYQNNRRFRRNGLSHNTGQRQHQQRNKNIHIATGQATTKA